MNVHWYAHFPGIALKGLDRTPVGLGQLVFLPFNEWRQLDHAFHWSDWHYEQSQPIFYVGEAKLPDNREEAMGQVNDWVRLLHLAFLLEPRTPLLPDPRMSATYIRIQESTIRARVGAFEREWIVYGNKITTVYDDIAISNVRQAYDLVAAFDPKSTFAGVEAGLSALALTAHPEFWWNDQDINQINGFVHCMAAVENILLPAKDEAPKGMKLTATFGQHAAVLTSPSREDLADRVGSFSALYRLRSRLMHGEIGVADLNEEEWRRLGMGRGLLRHVILKVMDLMKLTSGEKSLPKLLAQAYKNADTHQFLFRRFGEVQSK